MILEYEKIIGLYVEYKIIPDQGKCFIEIDSEKIKIVDYTIYEIERKFVKSIELNKYGLSIEHNKINGNFCITKLNNGEKLINDIKAYYIYNNRKSIIESI